MTVYNIDRETPAGEETFLKHCNLDSPLFKAIEKKFDDWIEDNNQIGNKDAEQMYFSEEAIYNKTDAIIQAIESIFDHMNEEGLNQIDTEDPALDIECQFE